jgi:hypothetical protein
MVFSLTHDTHKYILFAIALKLERLCRLPEESYNTPLPQTQMPEQRVFLKEKDMANKRRHTLRNEKLVAISFGGDAQV